MYTIIRSPIYLVKLSLNVLRLVGCFQLHQNLLISNYFYLNIVIFVDFSPFDSIFSKNAILIQKSLFFAIFDQKVPFLTLFRGYPLLRGFQGGSQGGSKRPPCKKWRKSKNRIFGKFHRKFFDEIFKKSILA